MPEAVFDMQTMLTVGLLVQILTQLAELSLCRLSLSH